MEKTAAAVLQTVEAAALEEDPLAVAEEGPDLRRAHVTPFLGKAGKTLVIRQPRHLVLMPEHHLLQTAGSPLPSSPRLNWFCRRQTWEPKNTGSWEALPAWETCSTRTSAGRPSSR